ncbi:Starch-binding associating with outer membrane [Mariniphaga anaerophila]|uniref:Starch-binding associating with outer membrane n=1 Tax=Mariniphaga anaerophila TaxID=1484053 RepID=A0A1M4U537_9BACT|nr:RagB/SusD family nutrient uptake outer membrane protein [Mariniphaga anaerophila]SHE51941.1 Starch-binding associating with outer membrane [Mariniphaga anaerophila]
MKLIKYISILFVFTLFSCGDDYLEKYPLDAPSDQTFLLTAEEMEVGVNNVYRGLIWLWNWENVHTVPALDYGTDLGMRRPSGSYPFPWTYGAHDATTGFFKDAWTKFYRSIERANYIIEKLPLGKENVTEEFYNRIMAEALWHRAFHYMYLTELFGDVPWVETVMWDYEEAYSLVRESKSTIVNNILTDLDFCIANLPASWGGEDYGRISSVAAAGLKARIALYNGMYDVAAQAAQTAMQSDIQLSSNYEGLFSYDTYQVPENLVVVQYLEEFVTHGFPLIAGSRNLKGWGVFQPSVSLADSYVCTDGLSIAESPLFDPRNPYENRDSRMKATLLTHGQWFANLLFDVYDEDGDGKDKTLQINASGDTVSIKNQDFHKPGVIKTASGYYQKKGVAEVDILDNLVAKSRTPTILMRYAEVLLTYAEAKFELGQFDQSVADATINVIRDRVGLPGINVGEHSSNELQALIRNERKVELALEGFRYFDIKRWKTAEHIMNNNYVIGRIQKDVVVDIYQNGFEMPRPTFDEYGISHYPNEQDLFEKIPLEYVFDPARDYLWPIPQTEREVVPTLTQNPGY